MFWKKQPEGRIFISYRRTDARGVAGRLEDTLEAYFGGNRVFRDIEDITGGADFGQVIKDNLAAADAVIVLIGPDWLSSTGEQGRRRLDMPEDWLVQEIETALQLDLPLFPVLIEDTPMPRREELPEQLRPLLRFNALSISDKRWQFDVHRLGKIISFEVPSANERKLEQVRWAVSLMLCVSLVLTAGIVSRNYLCQLCAPGEGACAYETTEEIPRLSKLWRAGLACNEGLLKRWQSGLPFIAAVTSSLLLFGMAGLVAEGRRRYLHAAVGVGALGSLFFYSFQVFIGPSEEPMVTFFGATLVVTVMLVLMNVSGFKPK